MESLWEWRDHLSRVSCAGSKIWAKVTNILYPVFHRFSTGFPQGIRCYVRVASVYVDGWLSRKPGSVVVFG
jgi:hypothetical protein